MADSAGWRNVPTSILDLSQQMQTAEAWASAQRAQLAETWANIQRQAVQTMADTWQKGTDSLDHFQSGYQGAQDGATGPIGPTGYNDMAGASSGSPPAFGANPQDATSPIDQARAAGTGPQLLGGDTPISGPINATGIPQWAAANRARYGAAYTPQLGTIADQPARSQPIASGFDRGYTPGQVEAQTTLIQNAIPIAGIENAGAPLAKPLLEGVGGKIGAAVTKMFHGTGSSFGVPDAAHFDPNGLFGPGYYLTSDARVAGSYSEAGRNISSRDVVETALGHLTNDYPNATPTSTVGGAIDQLRKTLGYEGVVAPRQWASAVDNIASSSSTIRDYLQAAQEEVKRIGANVRAVNVPNDLKLLDADKQMPLSEVDHIRAQLTPEQAREFRNNLDTRYPPEGHRVWRALTQSQDLMAGDYVVKANQTLQRAGYDGIKYSGGQRIPLMDEGGQPIEHTAVVIFPSSMPKLTNAISGTSGGFATGKGITQALSTAGGAYAGYQQGNTPEEKARNALIGGVAGAGLGTLATSGQLGRLAGEDVGAVGRVARTAAPGEQRAGNILLRKYDPGVQDVIDEAASTSPNLMESARRGVVSDQTVQDLATAAGTTVQKVIDRWKPGQAANAETIQALRTALDSSSRKVLDAQQAIQAGDNSTANQLKFQLAVKEHLAVQQAVSGVTAEAGRGLRALRQTVSQAIQSNDVNKMRDLLKRVGGPEWTDELSNKLALIDQKDPTQVATFLRDIGKAKAPDYINEWLYNAILSNPSTHIANSVSNTVNALLGPVERVGAAAVDAPLSALQGRPRGRFFGEGTANAYGLLQGLPDGVRAATYALQHGFSELSAMKGEMPRPQAFKGPIGNAINIPSRMLTAADAFFQPMMQRGALHAEIFRKAASEGLTGQALKARIAELTANVPPDLMERAGKMAEYQLYRQEPGKFGQWLSKGRDTVQIGPVQPLRFVLPFVQVPLNATKYGLERSPLGFLNPDLWKNLATKSPEAADNIARAGMGSLITAAIASQVANGNLDITGAAPQSPAEKDAFYRQGKLPFALKIGGKWYSYQRWEPFNHALTQVAAGVDAIRNAKAGADPTSIAGQAALTIGQNVLTQTFLSGIGSLINAATDPARYGESFIAQLETSMVPASSAMRAVANTMDPRQRSPQGIAENVKNVIPGLSQQVPSRLNNYGEEQPIAGSPFLPYKSQTANDSPLEMELARLRVEPGAAGKSLRGIDLTRDENQAYQRLSGQLVKQKLTSLVTNPAYQALSDTSKARALQMTIDRVKQAAADRYLAQLIQQQGKAVILQRIAAKKRALLPKAG